MTSDLPTTPNLDWLRKQAKALLRAARSGDPAAVARSRAVPRLEKLGAAELIAEVQLADAQHAIAREHGAESWPKLRARVLDLQPIEAQVERFLAAVRGQNARAARRVLVKHPAIAHAGFVVACCLGDVPTVSEALAREPALATAETGGWPPLLYVSASPFHAGDTAAARGIVQCARLLLDAGADANSFTTTADGENPAPLAALYFACAGDHPALAALLLERGANPDDGESVYHAAQLGHWRCLELLHAHGANLSGAHPHWNNTPLFFLAGAREGHDGTPTMVEGMRWLLEHGADPNVPSYNARETPLHAVARGGRSAAVAELLLAHGADPDRARADGRTAYALAERSGNVAIAQVLRARGARTESATPVDALLGACMRGDTAGARALVAANPGIIERLTGEDLALFIQAAEEGRMETVRLLVELGFDLAWEGAGGTALHHAAWVGNVPMVRELIALGAPLDVRDREFGSSPLGWAGHGSRHYRSADADYLAVVQLLIEAGAGREGAINRWGDPPENLASPRVAAFLRARAVPAP